MPLLHCPSQSYQRLHLYARSGRNTRETARCHSLFKRSVSRGSETSGDQRVGHTDPQNERAGTVVVAQRHGSGGRGTFAAQKIAGRTRRGCSDRSGAKEDGRPGTDRAPPRSRNLNAGHVKRARHLPSCITAAHAAAINPIPVMVPHPPERTFAGVCVLCCYG